LKTSSHDARAEETDNTGDHAAAGAVYTSHFGSQSSLRPAEAPRTAGKFDSPVSQNVGANARVTTSTVEDRVSAGAVVAAADPPGPDVSMRSAAASVEGIGATARAALDVAGSPEVAAFPGEERTDVEVCVAGGGWKSVAAEDAGGHEPAAQANDERTAAVSSRVASRLQVGADIDAGVTGAVRGRTSLADSASAGHGALGATARQDSGCVRTCEGDCGDAMRAVKGSGFAGREETNNIPSADLRAKTLARQTNGLCDEVMSVAVDSTAVQPRDSEGDATVGVAVAPHLEPAGGAEASTDGFQAARVFTRAQARRRGSADRQQDDASVAEQAQTGSPSRRRGRAENGRGEVIPRGDAMLKLPSWLTLEEIRECQAADSVIKPIMNVIQTGETPAEVKFSPDKDMQCLLRQLESLVIEDGILYRNFYDVNMAVKYQQIVVHEQLREKFMAVVHGTLLCHARTPNRNEKVFSRFASFPLWKTHLKLHLGTCRVCKEFHRGSFPKNAYLRPLGGRWLSSPGVQLNLDLVGPLPLSEGRFTYLFIAQDRFSRFLILERLQDESANSVSRAILKTFLKWGFYPQVFCDWGKEFINQVCDEMFKVTGVERQTSFSFLPRNNAVERCHRDLHSFFGKSLTNHGHWSKYADYLAQAYNSMQHRATGQSPNALHLGREVNLSLDGIMANRRYENFDNYSQFTKDLLDRLRVAYEAARQMSQSEARYAKKMYDAKVKPFNFCVGDKVLTFCPRGRGPMFPKWHRSFSLPAVIVERINAITFVIKLCTNGKRRIVHVDKMKLLERPQTDPFPSDSG
jgi:hypothetical protein